MTHTWLAPAKINLSLAVGPVGADGRHPLDSIVAFTHGIGDELSIVAAQHLSLTIDGPFAQGLSDTADNLILRAARLLAARLSVTKGARITLTKKLPIASGIGGGSADAAAALIGLNALWEGGLSHADLALLGAQLGADVPACLLGQALRMTGTGETTAPLEGLPRLGVVLVNPLKPCPTGPVYQAFDQIGGATELAFSQLPSLNTQDQLLTFLSANGNDLEAAAIQLVPEIATVLNAIAQSPEVLLARMSGSGATCFGLYPTLDMARAAAVAIKNHLAIDPIWVKADEIN
jgi:4-diphosphocytidyl-2-C-methyl-D-erythritol kinase